MIGGTFGPPAVTAVACGILLWIVIEDLRLYRIRNVAVLALAACFVADCVLRDRTALLLAHAVLAGVVFLLTAGAFALGWMGGGDAKLLPAAVLWAGPEGAVLFALLLFVATLVYAAAAFAGIAPSRRVGGRLAIPFGPSIACATLGSILIPL